LTFDDTTKRRLFRDAGAGGAIEYPLKKSWNVSATDKNKKGLSKIKGVIGDFIC